ASNPSEPLRLVGQRGSSRARDSVVPAALALFFRRLWQFLNPATGAEILERAVERRRPEPNGAVAQGLHLSRHRQALSPPLRQRDEDVEHLGLQRGVRHQVNIILLNIISINSMSLSATVSRLYRWMRSLRFNGVGAIGFALQLAVLAFLLRAGVHYLAATAIAV